MNNGYVRLRVAATVNGTRHAAGAIVELDAETVRDLLRRGAAVPSAGPGRRCLTADTIDVEITPTGRRRR